jgi:hypothetical protein
VLQEIICCGSEMWEQHAHVVRRECRRQQASLPPPFGALGQKYTVTKQGAKDSWHHLWAHIVGSIGRHHVADTFRIVDEDGIHPEERSRRDRNVERVVRKDTDAISLRRQQMAPSWKVLGMDLGCWRNDR